MAGLRLSGERQRRAASRCPRVAKALLGAGERDARRRGRTAWNGGSDITRHSEIDRADRAAPTPCDVRVSARSSCFALPRRMTRGTCSLSRLLVHGGNTPLSRFRGDGRTGECRSRAARRDAARERMPCYAETRISSRARSMGGSRCCVAPHRTIPESARLVLRRQGWRCRLHPDAWSRRGPPLSRGALPDASGERGNARAPRSTDSDCERSF